MKVKLYFTLKLAIKFDACDSGKDKLKAYFKGNLDENKRINLLTLLESNGVEDTIWAFRCTTEFSKELVIEFSRRAAARAAAYAAARAADYADYAAYAAARAAAYAAAYAAAARAADYAAYAAYAAARAAAYAAAYAAAARAAEREKQKQDLLDLLQADDE